MPVCTHTCTHICVSVSSSSRTAGICLPLHSVPVLCKAPGSQMGLRRCPLNGSLGEQAEESPAWSLILLTHATVLCRQCVVLGDGGCPMPTVSLPTYTLLGLRIFFIHLCHISPEPKPEGKRSLWLSHFALTWQEESCKTAGGSHILM